MFDGSLEVKLPTRWTFENRDGKRQRIKPEENVRDRKRRRKKIKEEKVMEEKRSQNRKSEKRRCSPKGITYVKYILILVRDPIPCKTTYIEYRSPLGVYINIFEESHLLPLVFSAKYVFIIVLRHLSESGGYPVVVSLGNFVKVPLRFGGFELHENLKMPIKSIFAGVRLITKASLLAGV